MRKVTVYAKLPIKWLWHFGFTVNIHYFFRADTIIFLNLLLIYDRYQLKQQNPLNVLGETSRDGVCCFEGKKDSGFRCKVCSS